MLSIPSVKTSGHHYTFTESELKDTQKQFTYNLSTWTQNFMHLPKEICSSTSSKLIIIKNFWKYLTLIYIKASFFVLYTVIPGYFNELIHEIMKWKISKIKHHSYEVLNLQVYLIVMVLTLETCNSRAFFATKRWFLLQDWHFFFDFTHWKWNFTKVLNHKC